MTQQAHDDNLQHTQKCDVIKECQNSHINANATETQKPMCAASEAENTKDKHATNVLSVEQRMLKETGNQSNQESLQNMAANANAAVNQSQDSLQSITPKEMGESIVRRDSVVGDCTNGLSRKVFRKKDSASCVTTAIAQEGNTGNVRTKASFTPGPWYVSDTLQLYSEVTDDHLANLDTAMDKLPAEMTYANARLIAACPSMLAALQSVCNGLYALRDHAQSEGLAATVEQRLIDECISAIAKAVGTNA